MITQKNPQPVKRPIDAVVLCKSSTGIGTVRGLALAGLNVQAIIFDTNTPTKYSSLCSKILLTTLAHDVPALVDWLIEYASGFEIRPALFPTCDEHALMLVKYHDKLVPYFQLWTTSLTEIARIVDKGQLYTMAEEANVPVIPGLFEPTLEQISHWTENHLPPYLIKPIYEGVSTCALKLKNLKLETREKLLNYISQHGSTSLVVQRLVQGGDGYIFDCYGLCDATGLPVVLANHRRWRQHPPNYGATCYGEIPANLPTEQETAIYEQTQTLLGAMHYHGIFGIEWLLDRQSGTFYMLDFNARPFSTIGHLLDCGLNLPYLAYCEMTGQPKQATDFIPKLKHKYWVDIARDAETMNALRARNRTTLLSWFKELAGCRSFAYWNFRDPLPGLFSLYQLLQRSMSYFWKHLVRSRI